MKKFIKNISEAIIVSALSIASIYILSLLIILLYLAYGN